jgi:excisionase family DNA binding protein
MTTRGTRQQAERKHTRAETAATLGVSVAVLERMMANREIGFRRLGRRYYFTDADIERYRNDSYFQPVLPGLESFEPDGGDSP